MSLPWPTLTTEEWETLLREQRTKELSYRNKLTALLLGVTWDEEAHPRDATGKFTGGGGEERQPGTKVGHKKDGGEIVLTPIKVPDKLMRAVLNQNAPADIASQMVEDIPGDVEVTWRGVSMRDRMSRKTAPDAIQIRISRDDGLIMGRTFDRETDGSLTVHHDMFNVPAAAQGKGLATDVLRDSYETYRQLGVDKVKTLANLDVGGYTWAKFGFKADQPHVLAETLDTAMGRDNLKSLTPAERRDMQAVIDTHRTDPKLPWYVANAVTPSGRKVGKELLLNQSWLGTLDMRDSESTNKLESYVKSKGK